MSLTDFVQVDDSGIAIQVTVKQEDGTTPVDLSNANSLIIYIYRPDSLLITGIASLVNDGTDGKIQYVSQINDLTIQGVYKIQAKYTIGVNSKRTNTDVFVVEANLPGVN